MTPLQKQVQPMITTISGSSAERHITLPLFGTAMISPNISAHGATRQVLFTRRCLTQFMRIYPTRILKTLTERFRRNIARIQASLLHQAVIQRHTAGIKRTMFPNIARVITIRRLPMTMTRKRKRKSRLNQVRRQPLPLQRVITVAKNNKL